MLGCSHFEVGIRSFSTSGVNKKLTMNFHVELQRNAGLQPF